MAEPAPRDSTPATPRKPGAADLHNTIDKLFRENFPDAFPLEGASNSAFGQAVYDIAVCVDVFKFKNTALKSRLPPEMRHRPPVEQTPLQAAARAFVRALEAEKQRIADAFPKTPPALLALLFDFAAIDRAARATQPFCQKAARFDRVAEMIRRVRVALEALGVPLNRHPAADDPRVCMVKALLEMGGIFTASATIVETWRGRKGRRRRAAPGCEAGAQKR